MTLDGMIEAVASIQSHVAFGYIYKGPLRLQGAGYYGAENETIHKFTYTFPEPFQDADYAIDRIHIVSGGVGNGWDKPNPDSGAGHNGSGVIEIAKRTSGIDVTLRGGSASYVLTQIYFLFVFCAH